MMLSQNMPSLLCWVTLCRGHFHHYYKPWKDHLYCKLNTTVGKISRVKPLRIYRCINNMETVILAALIISISPDFLENFGTDVNGSELISWKSFQSFLSASYKTEFQDWPKSVQWNGNYLEEIFKHLGIPGDNLKSGHVNREMGIPFASISEVQTLSLVFYLSYGYHLVSVWKRIMCNYNNWYKLTVVFCESVNLIGYITVFYLNNRVFLSRNYQTGSSEK